MNDVEVLTGSSVSKGMGIVKTCCDLFNGETRILNRKLFIVAEELLDDLFEALPLDQFHSDIRTPLGLTEVVKLNDIGVIEGEY